MIMMKIDMKYKFINNVALKVNIPMGYDTFYIITISADTEERRRDIAAEIIKHAWYPCLCRELKDDEFKDPILRFQGRSWRRYELLDLGGKWYDPNMREEHSIILKKDEKIDLLGQGDDDEDVYRIIVTSTSIVRQKARVWFVDQTKECEAEEHCKGCGVCAETRCFSFDSLTVEEDLATDDPGK